MSDTATLQAYADRALRLLGIGLIATVLLLMALNLGHSGPITAVDDGATVGAPLATDAWISAGLTACFVLILAVHAMGKRWNRSRESRND